MTRVLAAAAVAAALAAPAAHAAPRILICLRPGDAFPGYVCDSGNQPLCAWGEIGPIGQMDPVTFRTDAC